jgi:DNA methylase
MTQQSCQQLRDLSVLDLDFSLEATGFEVGEIDLRIEGLTSQPLPGDDPADAIPIAQGCPAISRAGDVWILGAHRVYCGSALDQCAYTVLMDGKKAALVFSDPPYNVPIDGNVCGRGAFHHREFAMTSGEMSPAEFIGFLTGALSLCASHSEDSSLHFLCMDWRDMTELLAAGREVYAELKNLCVWAKDNPGMGSLYRSQHELIFVFKHGRESHRNNIQLSKNGRNRGNVWRYPGMNSGARPTEEGNLLALHPTVKRQAGR